ncbi:MAG TPA: diguanylate cyclase [Magnetospirillaceae bacterium]|nr:diguanylate cyclase [Magnetospirillaceae bacterium]
MTGELPDTLPPARILIVDDDPVMVRVLARILAPMGEILFATDGESALRMVRERSPDAVLLDVEMPGMSGFDVCRAIKEDPSNADLPILFVSGHTDIETEAKGLEAGAVDYIMKPPSPPIVRARMRTQLVLRERTRQLLRLASIDGLTGLANRRSFDETLDQEWRRARRNRTPLSLALIDIDFFKRYNDHYGHQAGDDCLKTVATTLAHAAERPGEIVARYGGEEFAVVLPLCDVPTARALAEKMRKRVADLALPHAGSLIGDHVTISCGVATLMGDVESAAAMPDEAALIAAADQALYAAKEAGRDQVQVNCVDD